MMKSTFGRTVPATNAAFVKTSESSANDCGATPNSAKQASAAEISLLVKRMEVLRLLRDGRGHLDTGDDVLTDRAHDEHRGLRARTQLALQVAEGDLGRTDVET